MSEVPTWWKILNMDANEFSKRGKRWTLNKIDALTKVAPGIYKSAGDEVKAFNEYHVANGNSFGKVKLGRKVGSIPLMDFALHPELADDDQAVEKYFNEHPELRTERYSKHGTLAKGSGFKPRKT
jgi:hypothetical protein